MIFGSGLLHQVGDLLTAIAYGAITIECWRFFRAYPQAWIPQAWICYAFVGWCGTHHLLMLLHSPHANPASAAFQLGLAAISWGGVWGLNALFQQVPALLEVDAKLKRAEFQFKRSFLDAPIGKAIVSLDGSWQDVNPALCDLLGYSEEELLKATFQQITYPEDLEADLEHVRSLLSGAETRYSMEKRYIRKDGQVFWALLSVSLIKNDRDEPLYFISQIQSIDARKKIEAMLRASAITDPLTGLYNRGAVDSEAFSHLKITAVLLLDLDRFKPINDLHGHEVGDRVLRVAATRLTANVKSDDLVLRWGGDEFVILLHDIPAENAADVANRLVQAIKIPILVDGLNQPVEIGASIGVATRNEGRSVQETIAQADTAMYLAKRNKNKGAIEAVIVYEESMGKLQQEELETEKDIRRALNSCEFILYYQPIVSLTPGYPVVGYEGLIRWRHPKRGILTPNKFLAITERAGLLDRLFDIALKQACEVSKSIGKLYISLNVSPSQLQRSGIERQVQEALIRHPEALIQFEVIEEALGVDSQAEAILAYFKKMSLMTGIDDFGTGYSNMERLLTLGEASIEFLKLDRSMVPRSPDNKAAMLFTKACIDIAHAIGLVVVAEGIEEESQAELVASLGCDFGQGYFFGKPAPPGAVLSGSR